MKILVTGACGFVGRTLIEGFLQRRAGLSVIGLDNMIRPGSEANRAELRRRGVKLVHGDLRSASDFEPLPEADWVLDAAATPVVMAGVRGAMTARQLVEHNLGGTLNVVEYCRRTGAGLSLLSTSRVYSIRSLVRLPLEARRGAFRLRPGSKLPAGVSAAGVREDFSAEPPLSFYGTTKAASESLALEYGSAFGFPVWVVRCGVLGGAGQFGRSDQGLFSFWINSYLRRKPLSCIGFGGRGLQVRDCLHPRDLLPLLEKQMAARPGSKPSIVNAGGGAANALSLSQLTAWCRERFGPHEVGAVRETRPFDVPWLVMDCGLARKAWGWKVETPLESVLQEIARHAEENPQWLELSAP